MKEATRLYIPIWMSTIYLCGTKVVSVSDVSKLLECTHTAAFINCAYLKKRGIIITSMQNKKTYTLLLTEKGKAVFTGITAIFDELDITEFNIKEQYKKK